MGGFTKLFSRILTSSIWSESNEVRIVWITLLAATGYDGIARVTVPGLARLSNIPLDQTRAALATLCAPDPDSRTVEFEGRRVREERDEKGNLVGYYVFNYLKHRAVDATAAERKRRERARVTRDGHARQKTEDRVQKTESVPSPSIPVGREVVAPSRHEQPPRLPADVAESAVTDEIRRLQNELGARLARLAEHENSREMVPSWSRKATSYTRKDGTKVPGVADYRTITSIERLEKSIADADRWLNRLERGPLEASRGL